MIQEPEWTTSSRMQCRCLMSLLEIFDELHGVINGVCLGL